MPRGWRPHQRFWHVLAALLLSLLLNQHKCELITEDMEVVDKFRFIAQTYTSQKHTVPPFYNSQVFPQLQRIDSRHASSTWLWSGWFGRKQDRQQSRTAESEQNLQYFFLVICRPTSSSELVTHLLPLHLDSSAGVLLFTATVDLGKTYRTGSNHQTVTQSAWDRHATCRRRRWASGVCLTRPPLAPQSGASLQTLPCLAVSTWLMCIATNFSRFASWCVPYKWICGVNVDMHTSLNDFVKRALASVKDPSRSVCIVSDRMIHYTSYNYTRVVVGTSGCISHTQSSYGHEHQLRSLP